MEQIKDLKERIAQLETRRGEELESKKRMSSRPNRPNSYGKFKEIKSSEYAQYVWWYPTVCIQAMLLCFAHINHTSCFISHAIFSSCDRGQ
jgi:hypothetical protein